MSRLEQMIKELCPEGVEYKTIKETVGVNRGSRLTKVQLSDDGLYEVYHGSKDSILGRYHSYNAPANTTIVVNTGGIGGVKFLDKPFWCSDGSFWLGQSENIDSKYIYYCLSGYEDYFYSQKRVGGVPTIDRSVVENFKIPVPPLEIQREIVRILDNFTNLTAELESELEARKKQYEYYRDKLLDFGTAENERGGVQLLTLGDIGPVCMCKRILKSETSPNGDIPFYKIGTFGGKPNAYISKETFEKYKSLYSFPKKGDILISAAGTIGRTVIYDGLPAYFQDSNIVWISNDETKVLNKYLYYYYQLQPWNVSTGGTIARLYNDNISKAKIYVPPLSEQERIVAILDRFDKLCNDISEGLPAEIEARKKQYEYYRDRLLSFKER